MINQATRRYYQKLVFEQACSVLLSGEEFMIDGNTMKGWTLKGLKLIFGDPEFHAQLRELVEDTALLYMPSRVKLSTADIEDIAEKISRAMFWYERDSESEFAW